MESYQKLTTTQAHERTELINDAYRYANGEGINKGSYTIPNGWSEIKNSFGSNIGGNTGYFGRAYINHDTKEVIIAHRGTELGVKDLTADAQLAFGYKNMQIDDAHEFSNSIYSELKSNPSYSQYSIEHVGHSLGGYISNTVASQDGHLSFSIEAPSNRNYLNELVEKGIISQEKFDNGDRNFINIVAPSTLVTDTKLSNINEEGFVNTREYYGKIYQLEDPENAGKFIHYKEDGTLGSFALHTLDESIKLDTSQIVQNIRPTVDYHGLDRYRLALQKQAGLEPNLHFATTENLFRKNADKMLFNFQEILKQIRINTNNLLQNVQ